MLIDVSNHQGTIDWARTGPAVDGAYIKITEGTSFVDARWRANHDGARSAGRPVGAYHFADLGDPIAEANHFADFYLTAPWQLRPVLDIESPAATAAWLRLFRAAFRARTGSEAFRVYSSLSLLTGALDPEGWIDSDTDIWAAAYRPVLGWTHPQLVLWQNSDTATVPGVLGNVDSDQYQGGWTPATDQGVELTPEESNRLRWLEQAVRTLVNQMTGDPKGDPSFDANMAWQDGHLPGFPSIADPTKNFTLTDFARLADLHGLNAENHSKAVLDVVKTLSAPVVDVNTLAAALNAALPAGLVKALGEKLAS